MTGTTARLDTVAGTRSWRVRKAELGQHRSLHLLNVFGTEGAQGEPALGDQSGDVDNNVARIGRSAIKSTRLALK